MKCILFAVVVAAAGATAAVMPGCRTGGDCQNGICACPSGESCDFTCGAPPCHVRCDGDNPSCSASCANGTCTCGRGSHCAFRCAAPPCHVSCSANTTCSGTCADGQCDCGTDSTCTFTCSASPCHSTCAQGSHCVVLCPSGLAGTQGCDIVQCAAGAAVVCRGGNATTCGAPIAAFHPAPASAPPSKAQPGLAARLKASAAHSGRALGLVWRSAPGGVVVLALFTIVASALPPFVAYVGKLIVDAVIAAASAASGSGRELV